MITILTLYYICRVCSSYANHYILYLRRKKKAFFKKIMLHSFTIKVLIKTGSRLERLLSG